MFLRERESKTEYKPSDKANTDFLKNYLPPTDRNLILVIGPGGSGKSTFANYMAGRQMEMKYEHGEDFLEVKSGQEEICKVGHRMALTTVYPQVVSISENVELLDCAAYDYHNNEANRQLSVIATQAAIFRAKYIKGIVVIVNHNNFSRFSNFLETIHFLEKTITDFGQCKDSILFLLTRAPERIQRSHVLVKLQEHLEQQQALERRYGKKNTATQMIFDLIAERIQLFDPLSENMRGMLVAQLQSLMTIPKEKINIPNYSESLKDFNDFIEGRTATLTEQFKTKKDLLQLKSDLAVQQDGIISGKLAEVEKAIQDNSENYLFHFACICLVSNIVNFNPAILEFIAHHVTTSSANDDMNLCCQVIANYEMEISDIRSSIEALQYEQDSINSDDPVIYFSDRKNPSSENGVAVAASGPGASVGLLYGVLGGGTLLTVGACTLGGAALCVGAVALRAYIKNNWVAPVDINYSDIPFVDVKASCSNGTLTVLEFNPDLGVYKAQFYPDVFANADIKIEILIKKKHLPKNAIKIEELTKQIKLWEEILSEKQEIITVLNQKKAMLVEEVVNAEFALRRARRPNVPQQNAVTVTPAVSNFALKKERPLLLGIISTGPVKQESTDHQSFGNQSGTFSPRADGR
jgi:GTPase SAR1 family protein